MTLSWGICFVFFGMMVYSEAFLPENIKESIEHLNNHYVRKVSPITMKCFQRGAVS